MRELYLKLAAAGFTHSQIAEITGRSSGTVSNVLYKLAQKTGKSMCEMMAAGGGETRIKPEWRLTAQERNVLEQLAMGKRNIEIGTALGITDKTVSIHLVKIYRKLAVRNRRQAIAKVRYG